MENNSTEVQRWADPAMFRAEPLNAAAGPRVYLLWMSPDPLGAIAAACKMYRGEVVRDLWEVTDAERIEYLQQVQRTKLQAPFEFVQFHFLIEGVTRALTHQLVRQRTAAYAQESLRFAVKEDMAESVALPPSLAGTRGNEPLGFENSDLEWKRNVWNQAIQNAQQAYLHLVDAGMPAEDARGLLPHNITTRVHYTTNLRALLDHAGNRLCTQAQFEWRALFARLIEAIRTKSMHGTTHSGRNTVLPASIHDCDGMRWVWMANHLTELFKPACYQLGKCAFKAEFDRHCSIRERVDAHEQHGEPSSQWHDIAPVEWLANPNAAREQ
jgi:flavin-dependent thymidylate synthase